MTTGTVVRAQVGHEDLIHDAQLDYYGLRLATCSSDRLVKIFDVASQNGAAPEVKFSCDLLGHTGPVWEVAWAHPRWGTLLASCGYDGLVLVHRQAETGAWEEAYRFSAKGSVNSIEWSPFEYGLALACASSDGHFYILRCDATTGEWTNEFSFPAHHVGCNAVTWAPYGALGSLTPDGRWVLRVATGGVDAKIKIFRCIMDQDQGPQWEPTPERELSHHKGTIRDVSWAPSIGLPYNLLATCSEDGTACIWSQENENDDWAKEVLPDFKAPVWRVAWSVTGSLLAVSSGDADVTLWKESLEDKRWIKISEVKDKAAASTIPSNESQAQPQFEQPKTRAESLDRPKGLITAAPAPSAAAPAPVEIDNTAAEQAPDVIQPQTTWEGPQAAVEDASTVPEVSNAPVPSGEASEQFPATETQQPEHEGAPLPQAGEEYQAQYGEFDQSQYSQQQWDYSQQQEGGYYDQQQQWGDQQQYPAEGGWDQQQQQQWDPNQQQQWGEQQQQWDANQYAQWGEQQQPSGEGYAEQSGWSGDHSQQQQGLAAPPLYAGGMSEPSQPTGQWGAPNQQQQSW